MLRSHPTPFLGKAEASETLEKARVVVLPFGYEGGISYGRGAADAPEAVLQASRYLELYDEDLDVETHRIGIFTPASPEIAGNSRQMAIQLQGAIEDLLDAGKFIVVVGGDHSITNGYFAALSGRHDAFGVIQLDAHADLRESYDGSALSHACTMARALEYTPHTLQIGIRSLSAEEARRAKSRNLALYTMRDWRGGRINMDAALARLPDKVFLTLDVDVFDWSVIASTGTPEPGGCSWDEAMDLLEVIFTAKEVVGMDVVELSYTPGDRNSPFAVAKLIYKMIGMRFFPRKPPSDLSVSSRS